MKKCFKLPPNVKGVWFATCVSEWKFPRRGFIVQSYSYGDNVLDKSQWVRELREKNKVYATAWLVTDFFLWCLSCNTLLSCACTVCTCGSFIAPCFCLPRPISNFQWLTMKEENWLEADCAVYIICVYIYTYNVQLTVKYITLHFRAVCPLFCSLYIYSTFHCSFREMYNLIFYIIFWISVMLA